MTRMRLVEFAQSILKLSDVTAANEVEDNPYKRRSSQMPPLGVAKRGAGVAVTQEVARVPFLAA
ncbi:MAG: hypothetical protein ACRDNH_08155 [Gaiellaceae bacterium]